MGRNNIQLAYEIEDMIKKYNKKPEKKVKRKDIVNMLQNAEIIMAVRAGFDGCEIYDEVMEGVSMTPDIVKDGNRARLLPVFTSYEQIPEDYMNTFSLIRMAAMDAYTFMNDCEGLDGMVLNPFTEAHLELKKKISLKIYQLWVLWVLLYLQHKWSTLQFPELVQVVICVVVFYFLH